MENDQLTLNISQNTMTASYLTLKIPEITV
uniref:Uncharacterized protein n=1 Tax=Anguilla anguilla TaxID=7936 RepID=A0A0E9XQY9_ANGAN